MLRILSLIGAIFVGLVLLFILYLPTIETVFGFNSDPRHDPINWEVGKDGEKPPIHEEYYNKEFRVLYKDYLKAIDVVFTFANDNDFYIIRFGECFKTVLLYEYRKEQLPCNAVYIDKGVPTKNLVKMVITNKQLIGCQFSGPKYVQFNVLLSSVRNSEFADVFINNYEPKLLDLNNKYISLKEEWSESNCRNT